MKFFTIMLCLLPIQVFAQDFVNSHQHQVFEYVTAKPSTGKVNVHSRINNQVPGHSSNFLQLEPRGKPTLNFDIPKKQYDLEKKTAMAVFEATTGTGTAKGTAFLVGPNLVLTNKHVLANDKECRKFGIDLNHVKEFVPCKEVLHCSKKHDFCLIKLDSMNNGKEVGEEVRPLKLTREVPKKNDVTLVIGNAHDLGIQAASYHGARDLGKDWGHFNRAFSGNSGSPLINSKGEVLGIHYGRAQSAAAFGGPNDRNIGLAVKTSTMLAEMESIMNKEILRATLSMGNNEICK